MKCDKCGYKTAGGGADKGGVKCPRCGSVNKKAGEKADEVVYVNPDKVFLSKSASAGGGRGGGVYGGSVFDDIFGGFGGGIFGGGRRGGILGALGDFFNLYDVYGGEYGDDGESEEEGFEKKIYDDFGAELAVDPFNTKFIELKKYELKDDAE